MEKQIIKAELKQHNDKSNLTLTLYLTSKQRDLFLIEKGFQSNAMFKIEVKE